MQSPGGTTLNWAYLARGGALGPGYGGRERRRYGGDVGLCRGVAEREPERAAGAGVVGAHSEQNMAGFGDAGGARGTGGAGDALGVEEHQQRVALAAGE